MTKEGRETGQAILQATAELFAERGYKATTTRAIAERAGVNEVTLFRRFKNKRGILAALGETWAARSAGFAVARIPEPEDTRGTLEVLAHMETTQASDFGTAAMRLAMDAASNPEVAQAMGGTPGENFAGLAEYLAQRQVAGDLRTDIDARVMSEAFFALTSTLVMARQVMGRGAAPYEMPLEEVTRQVLEIYMDGVHSGEEKPPWPRTSAEGAS
jgi:AcrR family transcriptional regulator